MQTPDRTTRIFDSSLTHDILKESIQQSDLDLSPTNLAAAFDLGGDDSTDPLLEQRIESADHVDACYSCGVAARKVVKECIQKTKRSLSDATNAEKMDKVKMGFWECRDDAASILSVGSFCVDSTNEQDLTECVSNAKRMVELFRAMSDKWLAALHDAEETCSAIQLSVDKTNMAVKAAQTHEGNFDTSNAAIKRQRRDV